MEVAREAAHEAAAPPARKSASGFRPLARSIRKSPSLYLLALPGVVFLIIFGYFPLYGLLIAFKDFRVTDGILGSPWVGLKNFEFFFTSDQMFPLIRNTVLLNALFISFTTVFAVGIAMFLNEVRLKVFKRISQSVIFFPYFVSWVVVGMMVAAFFGGDKPTVNEWLKALGLREVNWFYVPDIWPWMLTMIKVWHGAGYSSIIYLAAITAIPDELYEAARIDGASRWAMMRRITLPSLYPTISILTLLAVGKIFNGDFGMIYAIVGDDSIIYPTTDVIDTYVFRSMRYLNDFGMSSAVGLFQSVIGFLFVFGVNAVVRRVSKESALF